MNKSKGVLLATAAATIMTGCGGETGNNNSNNNHNNNNNNSENQTKVNHAPVLNNVEEIKLQTIEGTTVTLNLSQYKNRFSDADGDKLKYNVNLPEGSNITYKIDDEGNLIFKVPLVDATEEFEGTIVAEDPKGLKSDALAFSLNVVDRDDDAPLNFSNIKINNTTISPDGVLEGTTNISDADGIESVVFEINGTQVTNEGTNTNFKINVGNLGLEQGDYELKITATGKIKANSENYNSGPKALTSNFTLEYVDGKTTIGVPSLESKTDTTINVNPGKFEDTDGVKNMVVVAYLNGSEIATSTDGKFNNLDASTKYEFTMRGEALNKKTGVWETKEGNKIAVTTTETPNEAPVANDDNFDTEYETAVSGNVLTNDTDAEGDTITIDSFTQPSNGTLTLNTDTGDFTYTPNDGFSGTDTFTYTVNGGDEATVTINVADAQPSWADLPDSIVINGLADGDDEVFVALDLELENVDLDDVEYHVEGLTFADGGPYDFYLRPGEEMHGIRVTSEGNIEIIDYDDGGNYFDSNDVGKITISHPDLGEQVVNLDFEVTN